VSTKIYNAYRFDGSLESLFQVLKNLRQKYRKEVVKRIINAKDTLALDHIDKIAASEFYPLSIRCGEHQLYRAKISDLSAPMLEKLLKFAIVGRRNSLLNISASAVIYPHQNKLYVQFFGVNPPKKDKRFKDFHYQDQEDKPDSISTQEWNRREKVWDSILDDDAIPAVSGLTYEFHNQLFEIAYSAYDKFAQI